MKNLVLLACLLVAIVMAYPSNEENQKKQMEREYQKKKNQIYISCIKEVGFTQEEKQYIKEGEFEKVDKTKRNCMKACEMKKEGLMEGSEIKLDKMYEYLERMSQMTENTDELEKYKTIASECHKKVSEISEECEKAGTYWICLLKA